jgi:RNA polymerase sigma-70 factor (ECF subfamily)
MDQGEWLAERFEEHRGRLKAVAYRMLGSSTGADDAVQEAWMRFSRSDTSDVENLGSWLTTVVSRVCLNMLQVRRSRPEAALSDELAEPTVAHPGADPEAEALLGDSVGLALMVVLESLTPPERVAFVLHDVFAVPFEEIAPIVDRSPEAARQLASRARRRVRGQEASGGGRRQWELVGAFLAAARHGDFAALLAVLDPDVVLRADATAVRLGASPEVRGARELVANFGGRAGGAVPALVNGAAGAAWAPGGRTRVVFLFAVEDDRIVGIDLIGDGEHIRQLDVVIQGQV